MEFDKYFRYCMLDNPKRIRRLLLTEHQRKIVALVGHLNTAKALAQFRRITIQNASNQLATLYRKGYLRREQRADPSGGIYYYYLRYN